MLSILLLKTLIFFKIKNLNLYKYKKVIYYLIFSLKYKNKSKNRVIKKFINRINLKYNLLWD